MSYEHERGGTQHETQGALAERNCGERQLHTGQVPEITTGTYQGMRYQVSKAPYRLQERPPLPYNPTVWHLMLRSRK